MIERSILSIALLCAGLTAQEIAETTKTWGERLGFPKDKVVLVLHADDIGMCYEANLAAKQSLDAQHIQSASVMVPCPWFNEFASWSARNKDKCVGLHLALTSEWKVYRWRPVSHPDDVPGLIDRWGYMWSNVLQVVAKAKPEEVKHEIRAQVKRAIKMGLQPTHVDTHMGTLYALPAFTKAYLEVAREFDLPAMTVEPTPAVIKHFMSQGYINRGVLKLLKDHPGPKLDRLYAVPSARTYEEKLARFMAQVKSLPAGITELYFHPSVQTEGLTKITNSWKQRVWEAQMFGDPEILAFFQDRGVLFTSWKEMYTRFKERQAAGASKR